RGSVQAGRRLEDGGDGLGTGVAPKRISARSQLEEHGAESKLVGAMVDGLGEKLLRSHVSQRAGDLAVALGHGFSLVPDRSEEETRQTEIQDFRCSLRRDH